ncbi:Uncharacterized protein TCM_006769 [Theobroma cacao]|uniref:Uncharacterized protein n=1 Tax=Theobroma cacao TaxID=3641 RepID=A0A061DYR2_THECC|nr:Uncharacterized protein TCM_006769 [Theobroma cacao]
MVVGLVAWLRATWVAVVLPIISASIPSSKLSSFHELIVGFAQRGKIRQPSSFAPIRRDGKLKFKPVCQIWKLRLTVGRGHMLNKIDDCNSYRRLVALRGVSGRYASFCSRAYHPFSAFWTLLLFLFGEPFNSSLINGSYLLILKKKKKLTAGGKSGVCSS